MGLYHVLTELYSRSKTNQYIKIRTVLHQLPISRLIARIQVRKITSHDNLHLEKKNEHNHICHWCNREYIHYHPFNKLQHRQFLKQCPFEDCLQYHQGNNRTHSKPTTRNINEICRV